MWKDLSPTIVRQRLIIEGTLTSPMSSVDMSEYIEHMGPLLDMTPITAPVLSYDPEYGWCGYMHWKESGMHMYTWDTTDPPFFSVDIYTCKKFDPLEAVGFTKTFFGDNLIDIAWKE